MVAGSGVVGGSDLGLGATPLIQFLQFLHPSHDFYNSIYSSHDFYNSIYPHHIFYTIFISLTYKNKKGDYMSPFIS